MIEKLFPDLFLKDQNWAYLWINILKFLYFVFIDCQVENYRKWLKPSCRPLAFILYEAFLKNKKRFGTLPCLIFCMIFKEKYFSCYVLLPGQIPMPLLREILGNICIVIVYQPGCDVINFEINLIFLIKLCFLHDQNVKTKM